MNSEVLRVGGQGAILVESAGPEVRVRVLKSQLVNLTLDWEIAALALDAQRYRAADSIKKESLSDSAAAYRNCIAALTQILSGSAWLAGKT